MDDGTRKALPMRTSSILPLPPQCLATLQREPRGCCFASGKVLRQRPPVPHELCCEEVCIYVRPVHVTVAHRAMSHGVSC